MQQIIGIRRLVAEIGVVKFGVVAALAEEAGLPEGYEALLLPEDGMLRTAELVEDELILAVPVIAVAPGTEAMEREWPASAGEVAAGEGAASNPFAALAALKPHKD